METDCKNLFLDRIQSLVLDRGEVTIEVPASGYLRIARQLRDHAELRFEQRSLDRARTGVRCATCTRRIAATRRPATG